MRHDDEDLDKLGRYLLAQEAACLDERRWDDWLNLYSAQCEYWVPMWRTEEELTSDPRRELSHIYYASRAGLEDRVMRIRTQRSPSSVPLPRTVHAIGYTLLEPSPGREAPVDRFSMRSAWTCHVFLPAARQAHVLFGLSQYEFRFEDDAWRIGRRRTQLQNDYIPTMVDIYCL